MQCQIYQDESIDFTLYSGQSLEMNGLTSFLVAFSFPWHGGKRKERIPILLH